MVDTLAAAQVQDVKAKVYESFIGLKQSVSNIAAIILRERGGRERERVVYTFTMTRLYASLVPRTP